MGKIKVKAKVVKKPIRPKMGRGTGGILTIRFNQHNKKKNG